MSHQSVKSLLIASICCYSTNFESHQLARRLVSAFTSSQALERAEVWAVLNSRNAEMIPRARPVSGGSFFVEQCCRLDVCS